MATSQKLPGELHNGLPTKLEDNVDFKPDIQILPEKEDTKYVFSVVQGSNPSNGPIENTSASVDPPSLFCNNVQNTSQSTTSTSHEAARTSGRIDTSQSLTFPSLPGRTDHTAVANHISAGYSGSENHQQPPTIFSAPLNSANLLSTGPTDQQQQSTSSNKDSNSIDSNNQTYAHSINIVTSNSAVTQYAAAAVPQLVYTQSSNQFSQQHNQTGAVYQTSGSSMIVDGTQQVTNQPTYVLLQAPGDSESGGQPQVFLAMQTTNIGQDSQGGTPYITLQPVSVDGELTSSTLVQEGVNLQQAVMTTTNGDMKDGTQQQVVLSIPNQQQLLSASGGSNGQLVTYLQPLGSIGVPVSNMDQNQVIMAASDLQGNLTLHNVSNMNNNKRNVLPANRQQQNQVNLSTPRRRLSTDPRSCEQCGRTFKYPSDLKKHLQIHTDIKKFQCEDCNRAFRRLHQLNVHRRIHTGEKPYVCNRCNARFRHDSTLTMHIRTRHDHLKPFECEGCSKKFGRMSHLRKHQRNVCGRASIRTSIAQCKYCDSIFTRKTDLKAHFLECEKKPEKFEKDIVSATAFECGTCSKLFARLYDFKRHQLTHTDEKPYGCPQCGKTFKERSSLNKHVKRMHCSEGDGTIPIDDDGIIADDDDEEDDEDEDELSVDETDLVPTTIKGSVGSVVFSSQSASILSNNAVSQVVTANGQTIPASEILNFPEVAEALGINSTSRSLNSGGNATMITITQPGNLETSEVSMDMEQNIMQDGSIIVTDHAENNTEQYIPPSGEHLSHITPVVDENETMETVDGIPVIYNSDNIDSSGSTSIYTTSLASSMVFKRDNNVTEKQHYVLKEDVADHVKAEQAAAHDLLKPEDDPNMLEE